MALKFKINFIIDRYDSVKICDALNLGLKRRKELLFKTCFEIENRKGTEQNDWIRVSLDTNKRTTCSKYIVNVVEPKEWLGKWSS